MLNEKTVSLCMIVTGLNDQVQKSIDSVRSIIDEIVIVEQSEAPTKELAKLANVYSHTTLKGNGDFDRQYCYGLSNSEYILALDGDEYFDIKTLALLELAMKVNPDVVWFVFNNTVKYKEITVNLRDMLGDDPHPRLWKKFVVANGQQIPTVIWSHEAHQFPQINSQNIIFSSLTINHERFLVDIVRTHLRRGKVIDPRANQMEHNFVDGLLKKFGSEVKSDIELHIPELKSYLRNK